MARGSKKAVALECLKDPMTRAYLLKGIGVLIQNELKAMCMDSRCSILRSGSAQDLKNFTWDTLLREAVETAPVLSEIQSSSAPTLVSFVQTDLLSLECVYPPAQAQICENEFGAKKS